MECFEECTLLTINLVRAAVRSVQWINRLKTISVDTSDEEREEYRQQVFALQQEAENEVLGPESTVTMHTT